MIRVFLSLPMSGLEDAEIQANIEHLEQDIIDSHPFGDEEIEFVHNLGYKPDREHEQQTITPALLYLGNAVQLLADCQAVFIAPGWQKARGCRIEKSVAYNYGIPIYVQIPHLDGTYKGWKSYDTRWEGRRSNGHFLWENKN